MRFLLPFFGMLLLNACNVPVSNKSVPPQKITTPITSNSNYPEDMPPVYENFDDLAYIFQQQTDTTYVINFWATWCKPCVEELPHFEKLKQKYNAEKLKVVLVSLDFEKQLVTKLLPFIKTRNIQSEVLILLDPDANSWLDKVDPTWSGAIPVTLVYNQEQRAFYEASFDTFEELEEKVQPFL